LLAAKEELGGTMEKQNLLTAVAVALKIAEFITARFDKWPRTCVPEAVIVCICNAMNESTGITPALVVRPSAGLFQRVDVGRFGFQENIYRVVPEEIVCGAAQYLDGWDAESLRCVADQWCRGLPYLTLMRGQTVQSQNDGDGVPESDCDEDGSRPDDDDKSRRLPRQSHAGPEELARQAQRREARRKASLERIMSGNHPDTPNAWMGKHVKDPTAEALRAHHETDNGQGLSTADSIRIFLERIGDDAHPRERRGDAIRTGMLRRRRSQTADDATAGKWYVTRLGIKYFERHTRTA
jgi:hypothetical protein